MATSEDFTAIVRALNGVTSAGQARAAVGAALIAIHDAYPLLSRLRAERERAGRSELDQARLALEGFYRKIADTSPNADVQQTFAANRKLVERGYIVIGGIEAEAGYKPQTSNLQILATSIKEAPAVFTRAVTSTAKDVVKGAGEVVGSAAGGILSGLGLSGTLTLVVVGLIVVVVLYPQILGRWLR